MRSLPVLAALALSAAPLAAQTSFSGAWQAPNGQGGVITLTLQQRGAQVTGTLSGNGATFQIQARLGEDGEFTGRATSPQGALFIEGEWEGGTLGVVLAEMSGDQPNYQTARELAFTRAAGAADAVVAQAPSGPRGGLPGVGGAPAPGARGGRPSGDPFVGTFANAELSLTLQGSGGHYQGSAVTQGVTLPVQALASGNRLQGVYVAEGQQYSFEAVVQGNQMQLSAGGQTYMLTRGAASAGPAAAPGMGAPPGGAAGGSLATTPQDQQIAQLLLSSPWCYMRYSQAMGSTSTERVVFSRDGRVVQSTNRETASSNQYGQYYGNSSGGDQAMWRIQNGMLMLSQDGATWQPTPLQITRNSNGYPIVTAGGKEYSQCN